MIRYEGVRFSDGSVALRRLDPDPCERLFRTFESVRECNEELGRHEVIDWLADAVPRPGPPAVAHLRTDSPAVRTANEEAARRAVPSFGFIEIPYTPRLAGHRFQLDPSPVKTTEGRYEPTEEIDEP